MVPGDYDTSSWLWLLLWGILRNSRFREASFLNNIHDVSPVQGNPLE